MIWYNIRKHELIASIQCYSADPVLVCIFKITSFALVLCRLTREGKKDEVVEHALAVRTAVAVGNYTTFFRLYRTAPNLSPCLMGKLSLPLSYSK